MAGKKYQSVNEYLSDFSGETLKRLKAIQVIIKKLAPESTERISYNIPAAFIGKNTIVYYSGYDKHTSLYPGRIEEPQLDSQLRQYFSGKSTLKFPNEQPFPEDLIEEYIQGRVNVIKEHVI